MTRVVETPERRIATLERRLALTEQGLRQADHIRHQWRQAMDDLSKTRKELKKSLAELAEKNEHLRREKVERERLEGQLLLAQKLESIGQLAAGLAHEINTPAQFIGDNIRFLKDSVDELIAPLQRLSQIACADEPGHEPGKQLEEVKAVVAATDLEYLAEEIPQAIAQSIEGMDRVSKIVQAMKEFSHPGTDEKEAIDLNRALETTIAVARNEWKFVADLTTEFDPELPLVRCWPGELNQVFLEVIINAAQAIDDGAGKKGTIEISTNATSNWAEIRIKDNGSGIPEKIRSRIFDPFFTTRDVGKGTGQGLNIAHNVVKQKHGGTISIESKEGLGTTVLIRLPMTEMVETAEEAIA